MAEDVFIVLQLPHQLIMLSQRAVVAITLGITSLALVINAII
jgi:hypothetical protein